MAGLERLKSNIDWFLLQDFYVEPPADHDGNAPFPLLFRDPDPEPVLMGRVPDLDLTSGDYIRVYFDHLGESQYFQLQQETDGSYGVSRVNESDVLNEDFSLKAGVTLGEMDVGDDFLINQPDGTQEQHRFEFDEQSGQVDITHWRDNAPVRHNPSYAAAFMVEGADGQREQYFLVHGEDGAFTALPRAEFVALSQETGLGGSPLWMTHPGLEGLTSLDALSGLSANDEVLTFEELTQMPEVGIAVSGLGEDGLFEDTPEVQVEAPEAPVAPVVVDEPLTLRETFQENAAPVLVVPELAQPELPSEPEAEPIVQMGVYEYIRDELGIRNIPSLNPELDGGGSLTPRGGNLDMAVKDLASFIAAGSVDEARISEVIEYVAKFDDQFDVQIEEAVENKVMSEEKAASLGRYSDVLQTAADTGSFDKVAFSLMQIERQGAASMLASAGSELNRRVVRNAELEERFGIEMPDPRNPQPDDLRTLMTAAPEVLDRVLSGAIPLGGGDPLTVEKFISEFHPQKNSSLPNEQVYRILEDAQEGMEGSVALDIQGLTQRLDEAIAGYASASPVPSVTNDAAPLVAPGR